MKDKDKTREQLINELAEMRQKIAAWESEERFNQWSKAAFEGISITDKGKVIDVNDQLAKMLGYESSEMIGMNAIDFVAPESRDLVLKKMRSGDETLYEHLALRKDGSIFPVEIQGKMNPYKGRMVRVTAIRDITERKQAEDNLHRRNRELALLNWVIAASAANREPEFILETTCRELALAFDIPQAAAFLLNQGKTGAVVVAEYVAEGRPSALNEVVPVEGNPVAQYLFSHKAPLVVNDAPNDPRLASARDFLRQHSTSSLLIIPLIIEGEVVGCLSLSATKPRDFSVAEVGLAWSIADQVAGALARARLAQTHRRMITAIEQIAESIIITDTRGAILYVNPAFEQTTGYSRAEVVGQTPLIFKSPQQDSTLYQELWTTISTGEVWHGQLVNAKKDGALFTSEVTITPVRDESGAIVNYVGVERDVTRELHLEEQYRQAQKMEAIGRLAGGVAHDFNNILTTIIGYTELLLSSTAPGDPIYLDLKQIRKGADRATSLTRQLLAFSRKQILQPKILSLNLVVSDMEKMLGRLISEDIELLTLLEPTCGNVKADQGQLEQVIMNLVINARDAMPEGGTLTIETVNVELDEAYARQHVNVQPGHFVVLTVSDTGIGMDRETKAHIFEPFFTTKEEGKGTGLGLTTVYGIVKQSGGDIWVYSELGEGTVFKIYLPRVEAAFKPTDQAQAPVNLDGSETILLVEDDDDVRELARRALLKSGYKVLEARHAHEALLLCESHEGSIDLLLTDVVMPKMSGREMADQLGHLRPGMKILYMSGYTADAIVRHRILDPGISFLQKPFSPNTLAHKVREVLDAH